VPGGIGGRGTSSRRGTIGAMSDTVTEEQVRPKIGDGEGDHDRFAHYVRKADIVRSNVEGVPVVALCGKKWIPNRDPERYPVCPTCKELKARLGGE
jgi:hypothetical protein